MKINLNKSFTKIVFTKFVTSNLIIMKKFLYLLLIVAFATSCSSDDAATTTINQNNLLGKWQLVSAFYQGQELDLDQCSQLDTYEFFSNNTFSINEHGLIGLNSNCQLISDGEPIAFTVEGSELTYTVPGGGFTGGDFTQKFIIKELTAETLKIEWSYNSDGFEEDGVIPESERYTNRFIKIN